ncbi:TlpA family protein disulfide reductase [Paenibacillus chitinolyticus]|uniref:TlpA family protein disulfide reductase n=1 Tax=Paenibacillus chitinolyticus TaxID=79263 RepID=UPI00366F9D0B
MTSSAKPSRLSDTGLPLGALLPELPDYLKEGMGAAWNQSDTIRVLLFASVYCTHCIDLLPHLQTIAENHPTFSFGLFTTGDEEDHRSMKEYFGWEFPVNTMDQSDMEAYFQVTTLPFMMLIDKSDIIAAKGVIYNADDFEQILRISGIHLT